MEVDQFCFEVKPGSGRLARCLKEQLAEQEKPGYTDTKISESCKADLDKFVIDKAGTLHGSTSAVITSCSSPTLQTGLRSSLMGSNSHADLVCNSPASSNEGPTYIRACQSRQSLF